jgi:thioredoxin reductase
MAEAAARGVYDVAIVGGGPAGLSAALMLGRVGRRVLVADSGDGRNHGAHTLAGFITAEHMSPAQFRAASRRQLDQLPGVEIRDETVTGADRTPAGFRVHAAGQPCAIAHRLLFTTGVGDELPPVAGLAAEWGRSVFGCVYCHGWELRDRHVAVMGADLRKSAGTATHLRQFVSAVSLICAEEPRAPQREILRGLGVAVIAGQVARVQAEDDGALRVVLAAGQAVRVAGLFAQTRHRPRSALAAALGCALTDDGRIRVNHLGHTSVAGVYAAGDIARAGQAASQVISAAASGAQAAVAIDQALLANEIQRLGAAIDAGAPRLPGSARATWAAPVPPAGRSDRGASRHCLALLTLQVLQSYQM